MAEVKITLLDWAVLLSYLAGMALIGIYVARRVRSTDHYFLGGRSFNKWLMMGQSFSIGTHADMPVSLAGAVYGIGFSAIWYQWKNLFITPFYWIMAPVFRRFRRTTMAEVFQDRYGVCDGSALHRVRAHLLHDQHGVDAEGGRQGHQPGRGRSCRGQRDRHRDDGRLHPLQFPGRQGLRGVDRLLPGLPHHRALVHADPARLGRRRRHGRHEGEPGGLQVQPRRAAGRDALVHPDAHPERPGRHHGAAAPARGGRDRQGRAHLPLRHGPGELHQAVLHDRLGPGGVDRGRDGGTERGRCDGPARSRGRLRIRVPPAPLSGHARPADRMRPRSDHGGVLGVHGRQRRALHAGLYRKSSSARVRTGTTSGWVASARWASRSSAWDTRSS